MIKCCVRGCKSTSKTHRIFLFPKNDEMRKLWLSFVLPTSPHLAGIPKHKLVKNYRVCHKHFELNQLGFNGQRMHYSYPSLFTPKEIAHGIQLFKGEWSVRLEHNYSKEDDEEDVNSEIPMIAVTETTENSEQDLPDPLFIVNTVKIEEESGKTGSVPKQIVPGMVLGSVPKQLVPGIVLRCIPKELVPKKILRSVPKELLSGKLLRSVPKKYVTEKVLRSVSTLVKIETVSDFESICPVPSPPALEKIETDSDFDLIYPLLTQPALEKKETDIDFELNLNKDDNNYEIYVQDNIAKEDESNVKKSLCVEPKQNIAKGFCEDTVKKDLAFQQDLLQINNKKSNRLMRIRILKHEVIRQRQVIKSLEEKLSVRNNHLKSTGEIDRVKCLEEVTKNMSDCAKIFTRMQCQSILKPRARRFDMKEKVFALTIYKTNKKCYELLRNYFVLPCPRSLARLLAGYTLKGKNKEREEGQNKVTEE